MHRLPQILFSSHLLWPISGIPHNKLHLFHSLLFSSYLLAPLLCYLIPSPLLLPFMSNAITLNLEKSRTPLFSVFFVPGFCLTLRVFTFCRSFIRHTGAGMDNFSLWAWTARMGRSFAIHFVLVRLKVDLRYGGKKKNTLTWCVFW